MTYPTDGGTDAVPRTVLDRNEMILASFIGNGQQTLASVARRTGLPRSSAHRLLGRLVERRWLRYTDGYYELGDLLIELGSAAMRQSRLSTTAIPVLEELRRTTGHVAHLGTLDGDEVVYSFKTDVPAGYRIYSHVGGRRHVSQSPIGRAILDHLDGRAPRAGAGAGIGACHYVRNRMNAGVGAAIVVDGRPVAGLSLCGPVAVLGPCEVLHRKVREAAEVIARVVPRATAQVTPVLQERTVRRAKIAAEEATARYLAPRS